MVSMSVIECPVFVYSAFNVYFYNKFPPTEDLLVFPFCRKKSLARFYDMKSSVRYMDFDEKRKLLITVGPDHLIKIWKVNGIL